MKNATRTLPRNRWSAPIPTPLGRFLAVVDREGALVSLDFDERTSPARELPPDERRARAVIEALERYFAGELQEFRLALAPEGTPFQKRVWDELRTIPYGETLSYGDLARRLGDPNLVRAVGRANGANPIPIVVPCHRVIGADGTLIGYGGGLDRKRALLERAAPHCGGTRQLTLG